MDEVALLAMAPGGDVLVVRDARQQVWVHPPLAAGPPRRLDPQEAQRLIALHDLDRVDRTFSSWREMNEFVEGRVASLPIPPLPDPGDLDDHDVQELLGVAKGWAAVGHGGRARKLATTLLVSPAAQQEAGIRNALFAFLDDLDSSAMPLRSAPRTDLQRAARRRWDEIAA